MKNKLKQIFKKVISMISEEEEIIQVNTPRKEGGFSLEILKDLYKINSRSGSEGNISLYVQDLLSSLKLDFSVVRNQIFNVRPNTILLVAHLDQVGSSPIFEVYEKNGILFAEDNLGADDKNGVWIILNLIKEFKDQVSFIFSTGEEAGCDIDEVLELPDVSTALDNIYFGLIFDREGNTDIIGAQNGYCEEDLQSALSKIGRVFNYSPNLGLFSDCDILSVYSIPCVNISCGYYNSHTAWELTIIKDLENALEFGRAILLTHNKEKQYKRTSGSYVMGTFTPHTSSFTTSSYEDKTLRDKVGEDIWKLQTKYYGDLTVNVVKESAYRDKRSSYSNWETSSYGTGWDSYYKKDYYNYEKRERKIVYECSHCGEDYTDIESKSTGEAKLCVICKIGTIEKITEVAYHDSYSTDTNYPVKEIKEIVAETKYCTDCDGYVTTRGHACAECGCILLRVETLDEIIKETEAEFYCTSCNLYFHQENTDNGYTCSICKSLLISNDTYF